MQGNSKNLPRARLARDLIFPIMLPLMLPEGCMCRKAATSCGLTQNYFVSLPMATAKYGTRDLLLFPRVWLCTRMIPTFLLPAPGCRAVIALLFAFIAAPGKGWYMVHCRKLFTRAGV